MEKMSIQVVLAILLGIMCVSMPITPSSAQNNGLCWNNINKCITDHASQSAVEPKFDPASPSFNITEFLCCPLMVQTAQNDKECFCVIDTVIHQDPSLASNITNIFSLCSIVDSVASLDNFCLGIAPTPAEAPLFPMVEAPMMPVLPPL
ncbi:hypothetical protein KSS87_010211 [Heliosperma pusillum]|nr:hypothetical protein KSS87_011717 [Heliosperma pusillum]KAH9614896.1 hypothetical protein KSS87_010211 [Heliosperma pusillum]